MDRRNPELAPESVNTEQDDDEEAQAQSIAEDAMYERLSVLSLEQSEKLSGSFTAANAQDLVDHMRQMDTSGTIDMSAYAGEETMDDLENRYGSDNAADEDFAGDDS